MPDITCLHHPMASIMGSFEEYHERRRINLEAMTAEQYAIAYSSYVRHFNQKVKDHKQTINDDSAKIVRSVIRVAVAGMQSGTSYIGDCYDVELPAVMGWYKTLLPASVLTSFAWVAEHDLVGMMVEKFTTSGYPDYMPWSAHTVWRISGDAWQLTFTEPSRASPYMEMCGPQRVLLYDQYDDPYLKNSIKINEVQHINLIGDESEFLGDVALLSLL